MAPLTAFLRSKKEGGFPLNPSYPVRPYPGTIGAAKGDAVIHAVAGSIRINALGRDQLRRMENHGKRLDHAGRRRRVREVDPLVFGSLDLVDAYDRHVEGARRSARAQKLCLHAFIQWPVAMEPTEEAKKLMHDHAVAFIQRVYGGAAVFAARLDQDEAGEHGVDVFFAPRYEKKTKAGSLPWVSLTKHGKELAEARFGAGKNSPYFQGRALQSEWHEHMRDEASLDWAQRGETKIGRDPDRLHVEEFKAEKERAKLTRRRQRAIDAARLERRAVIENECAAIDRERNRQRADELARDAVRLNKDEARLQTKQAELDASAREIEREKKTAVAVRNDAESDAQALRDDAWALRDDARDHARAIREEAANEIADRKAALDTRASGIDAALAEVGRLREAARRDATRIRDAAEADAEAATAQGRADVAARERDCARIENAASNLVRSATAAVEGRHDEEVTHEQVSDPVELATLREHAPDHRPTRGFLYRFWSLNDPRTGAPLSLPGAVRAALERAFDTVARAARRATALARDRAAWEAGRPARDAALAEVGAAEGRLVEIGKREAQAAEAARRALRERDEALGVREDAEDAARSILDQARAEAAETRQAAARSVREELRGAIDAVAADPEKIEADNGPHLAAVRRWFEEHGRGLRERARHEADAERTRLLAAARAEADALRPDPAALAAQAAAMASEVAARRLQEAELIAHVATAGLVPVLRAQGVDPGTCDALEWRYEGRKDLQDRFWSNPARPVRPVVQAARTAAAEMTEAAGSPRQRFERLAGAAARLGEAVRAAFADDPDERTAVGLSVLEALGRARGARDEKGYPHQPAAFVEFHPAYEALRKEARAQLAHAERVHQLTRPEARRDGLGPAP